MSKIRMTVETARKMDEAKRMLDRHQIDQSHPDDHFAKQVCELALDAVGGGNFGIGALLVDGGGRVVEFGHNEVFTPHFRSDRHAEMVVMNRFEDRNPQATGLQDYTLYTSLEPCPMCLVRLIASGVGHVRYVAPDPQGGMVAKMEQLPAVWTQMAQKQTCAQVKCSAQLIEIAKQIAEINLQELNASLKDR